MRRAASKPFSFGILMSSKIRSGRNVSATSTACKSHFSRRQQTPQLVLGVGDCRTGVPQAKQTQNEIRGAVEQPHRSVKQPCGPLQRISNRQRALLRPKNCEIFRGQLSRQDVQKRDNSKCQPEGERVPQCPRDWPKSVPRECCWVSARMRRSDRTDSPSSLGILTSSKTASGRQVAALANRRGGSNELPPGNCR
ncbi:hypothetical protein SAMN05421753_12056 [Planctomicrobium piriforme]|uniref:Uncharacterized protein n=1 Tax=Planctomicrobium piriforme TaxID=1576369 RepID=A0A1I3RCA0_9PLAN|nr:hypothetical protein SAMN05421753_12056 [Planctomicrobium piriforme]